MVMLSYRAGLRACEIASLRIGDVIGSDGEAKHTILLERWQTKGTQRQQAVVSEKLRKEITQYIREHRARAPADAPLLTSQKGGAFTSQTIQRCFASSMSKWAWMGRAATAGVAPC